VRVPVDWLQEFFDEPLPPVPDLVDLLNGLGLAVETVHRFEAAPDGVVIAEIESFAPIDGSDHLTAVTAAYPDHAGAVQRTQVVCGAPNVAVGVKTALALPGSVLPGVPVAIGVRTVLGVESNGMLASPKELGVYETGSGIITFGPDAVPGARLADLWPAETVIELELTPNRGDAFSLLGVARDLAAKLGRIVTHPAAGLDAGDPTIDDGLSVDVRDTHGSPRFTLRLIEGVTIRPSPVWLQRRLSHLGLRPRNNVVDVTNLVTYELGQPSHAYDRRAVADGTLIVRRAEHGEQLALLNEDVITLTSEDLVIATPRGVVGLAGVMGGLHDSVESDTTDVALEVALFDPVSVRRSGTRHKLISDARTRNERGVDPNLQRLASARLTSLIAEVAGGTVHPGSSETGSDIVRPAVAFRPARVEALMGFPVDDETQRGYLTALGCVVEGAGDAIHGGAADTWSVTPPSWRYDIGIEEDLVEEVGRLHGYEHVGISVPPMLFVPPLTDPTHRLLRQRLAALGLQEMISYVYTGEAELAAARVPAAHVRLASPQGIDKSVLRTSLVPGLIAAASLNRQAPSLALFEVGHVFLEQEHERLGLLVSGPRLVSGWRSPTPTDFYTTKGLLESLAALAGVSLVTVKAQHAHLHPGIGATVVWDGSSVGSVGRLHPAIEAHYDLPETYVVELTLPLSQRPVGFVEYPRQPFAERDLAVILPRGVSYQELKDLCEAAAGERLETLEPFDVYQGDQLGEGRRSVAVRFRFRGPDRAMTDAEVDTAMGNVIRAVRDAGYDVRA
jgi:phenylalanyl-tRNA synthetase beta chain